MHMNKKEALLNAAESKARLGGYSNFSFRELANEVGIKSASVHYHFPTKADLGAELAKRYTENFLCALGDPAALIARGKDPIEHYIELFRHALIADKKMCLCGLFGAESGALPEKVKLNTKLFFEKNIDWLQSAIEKLEGDTTVNARNKAVFILSLLEGAMMMSIVLDTNEIFSIATKFIESIKS
ncbi:MAG: TetR/AcrR family transcriptional repressor of nem operon [Paraglaciecola sp.]|jgi:TetR/AcrR family transcriptional repressor of nem operon